LISKTKILNKAIFSFLSFDDYLKTKNAESWLTIYRDDPPSGLDNKIFFSFMVDNRISKLIQNDIYDIENKTFEVNFFKKNVDDFVYNGRFIQSENESFFGLPLVIRREKKGPYNDQIDILQDFILYHDLRTVDSKLYVDPSNNEKVIVIGKNCEVKINRIYLRDFLAATKSVLVVYCRFEREVSECFEKIYKGGKIDDEINNRQGLYHLVINENLTGNTVSFLDGKEIISPLPKPNHTIYKYYFGKQPKKYESFIVRITKNGNEVRMRCNPLKVPMILCFFDKEVLDHYRNNESRFTIENNVIYDTYENWYIKYGINVDENVHVWIKDLGRLSLKEQQRWKIHNIPPSYNVSKDFFDNQLDIKFTDERPKVVVKMEKVNEFFKTNHNFPLFKELHDSDKYILSTLFPFLLNEQRSQFRAEIMKLAKLLVESIDQDTLRKSVKWNTEKSDEKRSLNYLYHFLIENYRDKPIIEFIVDTLRTLQQIRSTDGGHTNPDRYKKAISKLELTACNPEDVGSIYRILYKNLELILDLIPKLRRY
jgi:hypothetical protein